MIELILFGAGFGWIFLILTQSPFKTLGRQNRGRVKHTTSTHKITIWDYG
jgi:hypothetical protein